MTFGRLSDALSCFSRRTRRVRPRIARVLRRELSLGLSLDEREKTKTVGGCFSSGAFALVVRVGASENGPCVDRVDAPRRPPRLPRTPCRTPARLPRREAGSSPPASRGETRRTEGERYGRDGKRHPSRSSRPTTDAANIGRLETRGDDTSEVTRVRNHRVPSSPWLCLPRRTRRWSSRTRSPPSRLSTRVARCDGCRGGKKPFTTERVSIKHMNTSHK